MTTRWELQRHNNLVQSRVWGVLVVYLGRARSHIHARLRHAYSWLVRGIGNIAAASASASASTSQRAVCRAADSHPCRNGQCPCWLTAVARSTPQAIYSVQKTVESLGDTLALCGGKAERYAVSTAFSSVPNQVSNALHYGIGPLPCFSVLSWVSKRDWLLGQPCCFHSIQPLCLSSPLEPY